MKPCTKRTPRSLGAARGLRLVSLVLLLGYAAGCATKDVRVSMNFDPLVRFPRQATFAWNEEASSCAALGVEHILREVANAEFRVRGYRPVASRENPDFHLSYQCNVRTHHRRDASEATGSIALLMSEAETEHWVWSGFGEARVYVGHTEAERRERMRAALARLLRGFPPIGRPN